MSPDLHTWFAPSHFIMLALLGSFGLIHSGLASLRMPAEKLLGARLYRIIFAIASITVAVIVIGYFLKHRYDGIQLWQVQGIPGLKAWVWMGSVISFIFLYPATFNLLEIAAIQKPQVHLYETGIIRISRHPQMVGQIIWCVTHSLWVGTSFTLATSLGLIGYHLFGVWHGDQRLTRRYGEAFAAIQERTSVVPFQAILAGKQQLRLQEFLRPAYLGVAGFVWLFWIAHPWMMRVAIKIPW